MLFSLVPNLNTRVKILHQRRMLSSHGLPHLYLNHYLSRVKFNLIHEVFFHENNCTKLILNTTHHGWMIKKIFHSRSLKTPFWKRSDLFLLPKDKNALKYFVKSHLRIFLLKLHRIPHSYRRGSLLL